MRETITDKCIRREYDSWGDFVEHCASPCDHTDRASTRNDPAFRGVPDAEAAYTLARDGWTEGTKRARRLSDPLVEVISSRIERVEPTYVLEGTGALDIGRYLDGEPECWVRFTPELVDGPGTKHLTVLYNGTVSAGVDKEVIAAKGAVMAALVELLEMAGHRVQILLGHSTERMGNRAEILVPVKSYDQPLDIDRLTFALAHPACLRVLAFSCWEHMTPQWRERMNVGQSGGYGHPVTLQDKADITIPAENVSTPDAARAWILRQLAAHNITLRED